jgi:hypothetical protein
MEAEKKGKVGEKEDEKRRRRDLNAEKRGRWRNGG